MRDLLHRIWCYLNYPPDTHAKVEEVRQSVRHLSGYFPPPTGQAWKVDAAVENFRIKIAAVENDLRYLKTMVAALATQLSNIQDHQRLSQPWLSAPAGSNWKPESLLLTFLASFFPNPIALNIGLTDENLFELLLDAGLVIYVFEPQVPLATKLRDRFTDRPGLHLIDAAVESLGARIRSKEMPADVLVLRTALTDADQFNAAMEQLTPQVVETTYTVGKERPTEGNAFFGGRKLGEDLSGFFDQVIGIN
jgi:hypothetical protein